MMLSNSSFEISRIVGSRSAIARGVNAREMRFRNLVCSGGSVKMNEKLGAGIRELNDA
jgi:hypothetical protein